MQKYFISLITFVLLTCVFAQSNIDTAKDEEAVKAVIESLLKDHAEGDYEGWISAWIDRPDAFLSYASPSGHSLFYREAMDSTMKNSINYLKKAKEENSMSISLEPYDFTINVYKDCARAQFKIKRTQTSEGEEGSKEWETFENYALEKQKGAWKIASISAVEISSYEQNNDFSALETSFNMLGYRLLNMDRTDEAIKVFSLNVEMYPGSWNVYDSLGEAYNKAGKTALAIENYKKSVELNPNNENGKKMLEELSAK